MAELKSQLATILSNNEGQVLKEWTEELARFTGKKQSTSEIKAQCQDFLRIFIDSLKNSHADSTAGSEWEPVRKMLAEIARTRSAQGFSPSETAMFIFSIKQALFGLMRRELVSNAQALAEDTWRATCLIDQLGLYTTEVFQKSREEVIHRQQEEMLELSTPVIKIWDGILALPMIGTLDSSRTQVVMENLLQRIVETECEVAIIDITGVPTVDTLVAQHLIKTVTAARLMGSECIISGIRPQIAATIVHLGVELGNVATKATLADAFKLALSRTGRSVGVAKVRRLAVEENQG